MKAIEKKLLEKLNCLVGQSVAHTRMGFGSFFHLDFGKLKKINHTYKDGQTKPILKGEWEFWMNEAFWIFEKNGEAALHCESDPKEIEAFLDQLHGKKLLSYEITNDDFDMEIHFEDKIDLIIFTNDEPDSEEQWTLFTPDGEMFAMGPNRDITFLEGMDEE